MSLTDSQFAELKKLIETYLKMTALGSLREISDKELERNARILEVAGFSQREIGTILHRAQSNISDVLAGKLAPRESK